MPTLTERLAALRDRYGSRLKPTIAAMIEDHMDDLRRDAHRIARPGTRIAPFTLTDQHGGDVSSSALLARGPLIVSFFRGTWCPYCVEEVQALARAYDAFRNLGADVVVVTPQSRDAARAYLTTHPAPFSILTDPDARVADTFGLAYTLPDDLSQLYANVFGNDLATINASGTWRLPVPGRFVVDRDGTIVDVRADPDYRFRPEPQETIGVLERLVSSAAAR